jgi:hypothetical protein
VPRDQEVHDPEPARVRVDRPSFIFKVDDNVIVRAALTILVGLEEREAARHTEMNEPRQPVGEAYEEVLGAPVDAKHAATPEARTHVARQGETQVLAPQLDVCDSGANEVAGQSVPDRFYFGKFGHGDA